MTAKQTETGDTEAVVERFKALSFEEQQPLLHVLQGIFDENADVEREGLLTRLRELDALTGRPAAAQSKKQAADGRPRGEAKIAYYDPATGNHSTGRGSWKKADWVKNFIEGGGNIESLRVGPDNPLPPHLQS